MNKASNEITRDALLATLSRLEPALRAEGVASLALFGSRARQDNRADSDIDLLIDVAEGRKFSLFHLVGVAHVVEDELGLPANVFLRRSLKPDFRPQIQRDAIEVF